MRGNASGFQLDALMKLSSTKCSGQQGKLNMLDFVVTQLSTHFVNALQWHQDLFPHLAAVAKLSFGAIGQAVEQLSLEAARARSKSSTIIEHLDPSDPYLKVHAAFEGGKQDVESFQHQID